MAELTKEIVTSLQEVTKALNTQITQGAISAQRSNAQTKASTDITNKMLSQMVSVYKGSAPKAGASGPSRDSLLMQNLLELDKRREDKADRRAAEKAAQEKADAVEQRKAEQKEANLDRFSRKNIQKTMASLDNSNRDMGMGFAGFVNSFKTENIKKARDTKAIRVQERKTMKLRENNKLKFEIREKRAEAKKERFDKGNPLQRIAKFQKEAKLARITAKNEKKSQRAADRKERNTKLYNKMGSILKGVLVFGAAIILLGSILKGIAGLMKLFGDLKKSFSFQGPEYATDLEKTGKITDETMLLDAERDLAGPNFDEQERKIGKKNEIGKFSRFMAGTKEGFRDFYGKTRIIDGKIYSGLSSASSFVGADRLAGMFKRNQILSEKDGRNALDAASYMSELNAESKDNTVRQIAVKRQREDLVAAGASKQELNTFDMISRERSKRDRQDRKRLEMRASGKKIGLMSANKEDRARYNSMSQEEAQEQLTKLTLTDSGQEGMFKGTRDQEAFFQKIMGKYGKEGTSLTDQQGGIVDDIVVNNANFMKSNSQMTSALVAQFGKGGDLEMANKERNELLRRIADNQPSRGGGNTIITDNSVNTSGGGGGTPSPEINITEGAPNAIDPEHGVP